MKTIFEKSKQNKTCFQYNKHVEKPDIPKHMLRKTPPNLPEISECELVRHYIKLSKRNFGVDDNFYPLGSCTMKYNPKITEKLSALDGFTKPHPLAPEELNQGCLEILYESEQLLSQITGMDNFCMQPAAGAHGELAGIMLIKAYHKSKGKTRSKIIVPDSAHGTNPASAALCGYEIITVKSDTSGCIDIDELSKVLDTNTAGLMLTNPNTLGLFEKNILKISEMLHNVGGLLYYDGANLNAIMGKCRPGDMGFDIVHVNLHKTFATPHGCGGPGSGPVGVKKFLEPYLPVPKIIKTDDKYQLSNIHPESIGKMISFYGNFTVILKAYIYIKLLGSEGLKQVSENAVLAANYLQTKLKDHFLLPHEQKCMHEFVLSGKNQTKFGVHTKDMAKRLIDKGFHPPTIYFPLIIEEAIMIEPTETETIENLDKFVNTMIEIAKEAENNPELILNAPVSTPVGRLDETLAARKPVVTWSP